MPARSARKVKVNQRSGHDKHFRNTLTANVGTLVPILVDEVIPDSKVNLKINIATQLPPLVSETYMNVRLRVEAFAVPHRLCYANFEDFFADYPVGVQDADFDWYDVNGCVPLIDLSKPSEEDSAAFLKHFADYCGNGSLVDYIGLHFPSVDDTGNGKTKYSPVLPFVAYHLIWQEWYRNPRVQRPAFAPNINFSANSKNVDTPAIVSSFLPYYRCYFDSDFVDYPSINGQPIITADTASQYFTEDIFQAYKLADGKDILSLRQRNFGLDFFTAAMIEPQQGEEASVEINADDKFTLSSLRMQNSIQQFRERNGLTSPRFQQQIYARYGVAPADGVIQRPVLIGAATYDVYSHGVFANQTTDAPANSKNIFAGQLGSSGARAGASGSDFIIRGFHAKEPMYIIVLASLVPEVSYAEAVNPILNRYIGKGSITDMANAILQNVGPQPIMTDFLCPTAPADSIFAYSDRYSDWMFRVNEVHGEFREGASLAPFVLQRSFVYDGSEETLPEFGSEFLEIPTDYLDSVFAVSAASMKFGYWMDIIFDYGVSQPLQEYAIPTLQDPGYEHGRTITLRKNGQLL